MKAFVDYLRGPWCIAVYTWREGMRKKTLVGFLILSLLVIFGSNFLSSFLDPSAETDMELKLIKDICVTTIAIFGMLITVFISASVVPSEMENKVIYTVLSKPVRRVQYLLGKFIGVQLIIIINLVLMGSLFFLALFMRQHTLPTLLLWSIFLTYFSFLIVSAFTFAVSCASTSSVLPTIAGLFIYITGTLTEYLNDVFVRSGQTGEWFDKFIGYAAFTLYNVLPNLARFDLKSQIVDRAVNDPPTDVLIPWLVLYAVVYAISGYLMAYIIFRRKEL
jgi:ABC-type transport system involved in multi-copper enzyme maturation permease subunit